MTAIFICAVVFLMVVLFALQEPRHFPVIRYKKGIEQVEIHRSTIIIPDGLTEPYKKTFAAMGYYRYTLNCDLLHPLKMLSKGYRLEHQIMERAICCERYFQLTGVDKTQSMCLFTEESESPFYTLPRGERELLVVRARREAKVWLTINSEKLNALCL